MKYWANYIFVISTIFVLNGCQTVTDPSAGFSSTISAAQMRQLDSRRFETNDEILVLNAIVGLLQDLGFKLDETDHTVGLVSGSKGYERGTRTYGSDIRITVTTAPLKSGNIRVRATFQNIKAGHDPRYYRAQPVTDSGVFKEFFDKLSQSLFLEAHSL